jgi:hypothetical protein
MFCQSCGAKIEKASKFCAECGATLAPDAAPPPPPPPPEWADLPPPPPPPLDEVPPPPPSASAGRRGGSLGMIVRLVGLAAVLALVAGIVLTWPRISEQLGINASSPEPTPAATDQATEAPAGEPSEEPTGEPSDDPTPAPTEEPTPEPTPEPSYWTSGHPDPDEAIQEFIVSQGFTYGGPCETASSGDYCSTFVGDVGPDLVYAVGPLESEAEVWVLLHQVDGEWYVANLASAADGSPAPW